MRALDPNQVSATRTPFERKEVFQQRCDSCCTGLMSWGKAAVGPGKEEQPVSILDGP